MNAPFNVRQLAQYGRTDAAIPGTVTLMQMGEQGSPYASILTRDLVTSALAAGGNLNLAAGSGSIAFLFDQGAGAVTLSVVQGELQVSPSLRTSTLDATFVNAASVTINGVPAATRADLDDDRAQSVTSFNQRTGDILLEDVDILRAGGAPQANAHFTGWITAPSVWDTRTSDDTVATTNWVHRLLCEGAVTSFNCRTGPVTLTTADVNQAYAVPGPPFPSAPSPVIGDASDRIATTAFVDDTLEDYAPLYSPHLTGIPTSTTPPVNDSSTAIATTSFVNAAIGSNYHALGLINIKDFGAKGDGVTDDSAAFLAFNAWASAQIYPIFLFIPPGTYAGLKPTLAGPTQPRGGADFLRGIKDITVFAYGATLANLYTTSPLGVNTTGVITVSARLAAVPLQSASVTLLNAPDAANFAVGNWVMVTSLEMQGQSGFPPNWYYFDFAKIASIAGTTVTFVEPLMFSHKSTYPQTVLPANVSTVGFDCGGPASMFLLRQDWDQNVKIMGMHFDPARSWDIIMCARRVEMIDCDFVATASVGCIISQSREAIFHRCNFPYMFQIDKDIDLCRLDNCVMHILQNPSSSVHKFHVNGCHIGSITYGNIKNTMIENSLIENYFMVPPTYGDVRSLTLRNTHIGGIQFASTYNSISLSLLTFSNGTFSMPLTQTATNLRAVYKMAIPGTRLFFGRTGSSTMNFGNPFLVTAVYQDTNNVYFDTTLTALPTYTGAQGTPDLLSVHPCAAMTATNITGSELAIQLGKSRAGVPGYPMYSYAHKVYGADLQNVGANAIPIRQWGNLVQLNVNVIRADTGANPTLALRPLAYNTSGAVYFTTANAAGAWNPVFDLKTAGLRSVTPTTVTGSVGADAIGAAPGVIWFAQNGLAPLLSLSISGNTPAQNPIVEIELITDQGIHALEYNALL